MNIALEVRAAAQPLTLVETLAHELRQPLSAIESTAYYLAMVLPPGEKRAQEQAARLQRLVEHASWILSCAVQLEDEAPLAPESVDLEELITQTAASRSAGGHAPPRMILAGNLPSVKLDPGRGRALMENLFGMLDVHPPVRCACKLRAFLAFPSMSCWNSRWIFPPRFPPRPFRRTSATMNWRVAWARALRWGLKARAALSNRMRAPSKSISTPRAACTCAFISRRVPPKRCCRPRFSFKPVFSYMPRYSCKLSFSRKHGVTMKIPSHGCRAARHFGSNCGAKARFAGAFKASPSGA